MNLITTPNAHGDGITCFGPESKYEAGVNAYKSADAIVLENTIVDFAALSLSEQDGGIDCVDGANVLLLRCRVRNVGKAMLCGNEDEGGGFAQVVMEGCVIESFGRRGPEVKNGSTVTMRRCVIKNCGHPDYFTERSFGAWAHSGGSIRAESCVFWQDSFFPGGLWQFVKDLAGHIGQCFKDRHFSFRDLFLPGVCRGLTAGPGGFVESVNCYRNKRWIVIEGHQGPWMPEDEAMDAYREKYEKKSP